jgi:hypothetical protein
MGGNFSKRISYDGHVVSAVILPQMRKDGMYYEVNIKGFSRFYMAWSPADRYDVVPQEGLNLPYNLVLAVSDAIEEEQRKN